MANTSITNKRRRPGRKAEVFRIAWNNHAAEAEFAGKTLADLEAALAALEQARKKVTELTLDRSAAMKTRSEEETRLNELLILITHGVRSHPDHGEDSAIYRAMGFVPKSERSSGLTHRTQANTAPPGNEDAAA